MQNDVPVIYLDIDGILNNISQVKNEMLKSYHPTNQINSVPLTTRLLPFDEDSLEAINFLLYFTSPHLRITSSWRYYSTNYSLKKLLEYKGLFVDSLESFCLVTHTNSSRARNIDDDLLENIDICIPYVIIEDSEKDVLETFPEESVVYVRNGWLKNGFDMQYAKEALSKLSRQYWRYYGQPAPWGEGH